MKKIILLISFCCFGFIMQAQEFLIESLGGIVILPLLCTFRIEI